MLSFLDSQFVAAVLIGILAFAGYLFTAGPGTTPQDLLNRSEKNVTPASCHTAGCSGQLCVPTGENPVTTCEYQPEYGCLVDCRVRDGTCGFDPVLKDECTQCVQQCRDDGRGEECFQQCYPDQ